MDNPSASTPAETTGGVVGEGGPLLHSGLPQAQAATSSPPEKMWDVLLHRCTQLLEWSVADERRGETLWDGEMTDNLRLSLRFRERQQKLLQTIMRVCNARKLQGS